ncbi:unannotated protein [freshwater metagenome]|uniref:Unannotated protein n=1 Tax=freshwater metagenome TaxID=449393 RepID=A0A6J7UL17_9ZZZZ|nr:hypothetical protein [Actinomycetota bacterium]
MNIPSDFRLPSWKVPVVDIDLPEIDVPQIAEKVSEYGKEALYITVGTGVLAFQQLQVRRREMMTTLHTENPDLETHISEVVDHAKSIATILCDKLSEHSPLRNAQ